MQQDGHNNASFAFSPDGKILAGGTFDGLIRLWDASMHKAIQTLHAFPGGMQSVGGLAFSPDGKTLASGLSNGNIQFWDTSTWQISSTISSHTGGVSSLAFSPDGKTLASGSYDKTIELWDVASGKLLNTPDRAYRCSLGSRLLAGWKNACLRVNGQDSHPVGCYLRQKLVHLDRPYRHRL